MSRQLRIEYESAFYYIQSRGSSYKVYAYGRPSPEWLRIVALLSQIPGNDKKVDIRE